MTTTELILSLRQQVTNQATWGGNREIVLLMTEAADRLEELDERVAISAEIMAEIMDYPWSGK